MTNISPTFVHVLLTLLGTVVLVPFITLATFLLARAERWPARTGFLYVSLGTAAVVPVVSTIVLQHSFLTFILLSAAFLAVPATILYVFGARTSTAVPFNGIGWFLALVTFYAVAILDVIPVWPLIEQTPSLAGVANFTGYSVAMAAVACIGVAYAHLLYLLYR